MEAKNETKTDAPKEANDIRIGMQSRVRNVIRYCNHIITEGKVKELKFSAVGGAIGKLVDAVEVLKIVNPGLNQINKITTVSYQTVDTQGKVFSQRLYPKFEVVLTLEEVKEKSEGFQPKLAEEERTKLLELLNVRPERTEGGEGRGGRGFGGERGGRGRGFGGDRGSRGFGGDRGGRGFGGRGRGRGFGGDRGGRGRGFGGDRGSRGFGGRGRGFGGRDQGYERRDQGYGGRDQGYGGRDQGYDRRDQGYGGERRQEGGYEKRDQGYGGERRDQGYSRPRGGFSEDREQRGGFRGNRGDRGDRGSFRSRGPSFNRGRGGQQRREEF